MMAMIKTMAEIGLATPGDVAGMLDLQNQNLTSQGGTLSVAFSRHWFESAIADMPVIVARKEDRIIGYVLSSRFATQTHLSIVRAMLSAYPASGTAYLYGPICVAQSERGSGLAGKLFVALCIQLPGREGVTFIRSDNNASLKAHAKMGMIQVAGFTHDDLEYVVVEYRPEHPQRRIVV